MGNLVCKYTSMGNLIRKKLKKIAREARDFFLNTSMANLSYKNTYMGNLYGKNYLMRAKCAKKKSEKNLNLALLGKKI